jgi:hypothetical protein
VIHLHLVITNVISLLNKVSFFHLTYLFIYLYKVDETDICIIILSNELCIIMFYL